MPVGSAAEHATFTRERHWGKTLLANTPVGPIAIARSLGIDVFRSRLKDGVSGVLVKKRDNPPAIHLNRTDPSVRRRFTCAHEIGHYVYRSAHGDDDYGYIDQRAALASAGTDAAEKWANEFAAELLMPKLLVRTLYASEEPPEAMAATFAVSLESMNYRLRNLGLR